LGKGARHEQFFGQRQRGSLAEKAGRGLDATAGHRRQHRQRGDAGYKSKSVEFESMLARQLNATGASDRSIQNALDRVRPTIVQQEGTEAREDGNNVDEDKESVEMARTLIEYNYLCNALSSQINGCDSSSQRGVGSHGIS
jgi:flagellar basal-body rod protein FlgB